MLNVPNVSINQHQQLVSKTKLNTNAVYTTWQNPTTTPVNVNDKALTIIHLNDNHRKVKGIAKFKTAIQEIIQKAQMAGHNTLNVHSGDYNVGRDAKKLKLQVEMLNELGVQYAAIGNHEFDIGSQAMANELASARFISLAANINYPEGSGLDMLAKNGKLTQSTIYEANGQKYGLIGLSPVDLVERQDPNVKLAGVKVLPEDQTIKAAQAEVDKLRAQGINKIILVSHVGLELDKKIARQTDGIDIILGGHSHDLLKPLEPGVSMFNSKSNEPVLVFQNGKNAEHMGVTDTYFDDRGIVKAAIARQEKAGDFQKDQKVAALEDQILGISPVIGVSADTYTADGVKMKENALANYIADAVKAKTGADFALFQSFALRDTIEKGNITERNIDELLPFIDAVHVSAISGQDVIDALTNGAMSYARPNKRPGILQVSGIQYTISPEGKAVNVMVKNKAGQYEPINPAKEYMVAYDQYLIKGCEGFKTLAQPQSVVKATMDSNADILKEAIKQTNFQPIVMKTDGRVSVNANSPKAPVTQQAVVSQPVAQPVVNEIPKINPRVSYTVPVTKPVAQPTNNYYYYAQPTVQYAAPQAFWPQNYYYYGQPVNMTAQATSYVRYN